jgi:hypothetical protein
MLVPLCLTAAISVLLGIFPEFGLRLAQLVVQ